MLAISSSDSHQSDTIHFPIERSAIDYGEGRKRLPGRPINILAAACHAGMGLSFSAVMDGFLLALEQVENWSGFRWGGCSSGLRRREIVREVPRAMWGI